MAENEEPPLNNQEHFSLPSPSSEFPKKQQGIYDQLNNFLGEQDQQQKAIQEARDILGESARDLNDEQVFDLANEVQFLVDSWLEEFERDIFEGKSLEELIKI